ncbi:MAG: Response regulator receiver and domain protein [Pseudonocardiales bacterium]|nr:Response regulator receiver and domain protein [Pseudonocardiales bacterium]
MDNDEVHADPAQVSAELAHQFMELVRTMVTNQPDEHLTVKRVLEFASKAVPGADHASITRVSGNARPKTIVATGELPVRVDHLQYETGQGPCLQSLDQSDIAYTGNLPADGQWPEFAARAAQAGVRSMLSFRLFLTGAERGSLNFYSKREDAFDQMALSLGAIFASYASLTLLNDLHRDEKMHLSRALESNREIGMAMGILMAHELSTPEGAFNRLRVASQLLHRKLHDLAQEVILTGSLPELPNIVG